jgi:Domain of unknown function (DUF4070)
MAGTRTRTASHRRGGEADETWPQIVADAAAGRLKEVYAPGGCFRPGTEAEPSGVPADPFIFGLDHDTAGVAQCTLAQVRMWPPVLPVFGQITPFPATPLYTRLEREGRLTRPKHWPEFAPFQMAHTPLRMSISQVETEVHTAWSEAYSPAATAQALDAIADEPVPYKISHLVARIFFRGIYFPPCSPWGWLKVIASNRASILACPLRIVYTMARHAERRPPAACRRARVIRSFGIGIRLRQAVPR